MKLNKLWLLIGMCIILASFSSATICTGGTITYHVNATGNYTIHTFTANGSLICTQIGTVRTLIIGAGGGGGGDRTGGAGAGGYIEKLSNVITTVATYPVVVGNGVFGGTGQNSQFNGLIAYGGGYGGAQANGGNGGSGGGGGAMTAFTGGTAVTGQGYAGSDSTDDTACGGKYTGAGGGGAGAAGGVDTCLLAGSGGVGLNSSINGTSTCRAGGGAGYYYDGAGAGTSSCGGGGFNVNGTNGTGGGGGGWTTTGGSGIVIVSYIPNLIEVVFTYPNSTQHYNFLDYNGSIVVGSSVNATCAISDYGLWSAQTTAPNTMFNWYADPLTLPDANYTINYTCSMYNSTNYLINPLTAWDSTNINNGTFTGYTFNHGAISGATQLSDGGMSFDGVNNYINSTYIFPNGNVSVSICAWLYKNEDKPVAVLGSYSTVVTNRSIMFFQNSDTYKFYISNGNYIGSQVIPINTWAFICGVTNGTRKQIYTNGTLYSTQDTGTGIGNSTMNYFIGSTGASTFFNGSIQGVTIYNKVLNSTEILAQYNAGRNSLPISGDGLVASYPMQPYANNGTHTYDLNQYVSDGNGDNGLRANGSTGTYATTANKNISSTGEMAIYANCNLDYSPSSYKYYIGYGNGTSSRFSFGISTSNRIFLYDDIMNEGDNTILLDPTIINTKYNVIANILSNGTKDGYVNGIYKASDNTGANASYLNGYFTIGRMQGTTTGTLNGTCYQAGIWNRTLTQSEITTLNNNWSYNPADTIATGLVAWYDFEPEDVYYDPYEPMKTMSFVYDNAEPVITQVLPNPDNTTAFDLATSATATLNLAIDTTDTYLYQANLTLRNATGHLWYSNYSGILPAGTTSYVWNGVISNLTPSRYYLSVESSDSHTNSEIGTWSSQFIEKTAVKSFLHDGTQILTIKPELIKESEEPISSDKVEGLVYRSTEQFGDIGFIIDLIDSDIPLKEVQTLKKTDRYSPKFTFEGSEKDLHTYTFQIRSTQPLDYIENSDYIGHFVSTNGMKGVWYDSMFDGYKSSQFKIIKINDNTYNIEIQTLKTELEFNSLGGLNYNFINSTFDVLVNMTVFARDSILGANLTNFSVTYNGTTQSTGTSNRTTFYVPTNSTFTINASKYNYNMSTASVTSNFSSFNYTINLTSPSLNMSFYDETSYLLINTSNINITLICAAQNYSININTTTGFKNISSLPNGFYEITYGAIGYYTRTYYATLSEPNLMTVKLFLIDTSNGTRTIWQLYDYNFNPAQNIIIKLQRFYTQSNSYETVSMAKTGFDGQAVLYVDMYDVPYKSEYDSVSGDIYRINSASLIVTTTPSDKINLAEALFYSFDRYNEIYTNLTFDNSTPTVYARLIWSSPDNLVRRVCLDVKRTTLINIYQVCLNCSNTTAGSLSCVIDSTLDGEFKASALIDINSTGSWYTTAQSFYKIYTTNSMGRQSMFYGGVIIGTLALISGSIMSSIIMVIMGLIALSMVGFIVGLSTKYIIYIIILGVSIIIYTRWNK